MSDTDAGLSLDKLNAAFAEMLSAGDEPYGDLPAPGQAELVVTSPPAVADEPSQASDTEITPRGIVEAMLFVGLPDGAPLSAERMAGLMRGVRSAEVDDLVADLQAQYAATDCPYEIVGSGAGYRLALREECAGIREKMLGRARQGRLSQAAIEVLSLVAYRGPLSGDEVSKWRGAPSGHVLTQLVRRQLLSMERSGAKRRAAQYRVTERFLRLFGLTNLDELPRAADAEPR